MNPAAERILGKTREDFLGQTSVSVEHDTLREDGRPFPGMEHPSMVALRTGKPSSDVIMQVYNPKERRYRWIDISAVPLFRPGETSPYQAYAVFEDVSERKQVEQALRLSEERFRTFYETMLDGVLHFDRKGIIISCNPAAAKMLGVRPQDLIGASTLDPQWNCIHEDGSIFNVETQPAAVALQEGRPVHNVIMGVFISPKNKLIWIDVNALPFFLPGETRPYEVYTTFKDVTLEKEAAFLQRCRLELIEFAPTHSAVELMQKALDDLGALLSSPVGFFHEVVDDEQALQLLAWSSKTLADFCKMGLDKKHYPIESAGVWADALRERRALIHNDFGALPGRHGFPEGHVQLHRELVVPIVREAKIVALLGMGNKPQDYTSEDVELAARFADYAWDIVQHKQVEESVRQANERITQIVSNIEDIFWVVEPTSRKNEYISPAFEAIIGQKIEVVDNLTHGYESLILPEDLHIFQDACELERQGQKTDSLYRIRRPDGGIRWLRMR